MGIFMQRPSQALVLIFIALSTTPQTLGYPNGAPANTAICESMLPSHNAPAQTTPSLYTTSVAKLKVNGGETVKIELKAPAGDYFKGFLVQMRKVGVTNSALGSFKPPTSNSNEFKSIDCFGKTDSAVTHTNGEEKANVTFEWVAPNDEDINEIQLVVTFVRNGDEIWLAVPHPEKLSLTKNLKATTKAPEKQMITEKLKTKLKEVYGDCDGNTKGCLGTPDHCIQDYLASKENDSPPTCDVLLTWKAVGERNVYSLSGKIASKGYVAMGFSEDKDMGDDSVIGCFLESGDPKVGRFFNIPKSSPSKGNTKENNKGLASKDKDLYSENGHIFCDYELEDHSIPSFNVTLRKRSYYILLAKGRDEVTTTTGLGYHDSRVPSSAQIHITDVGIFGAKDTRILIQLHGALMIIAWLVLASLGMFTARYYKLTHTKSAPCGKAFWFSLHIFCMFTTVIFTVCGAILIFIHKGGYKPADGKYWHPILGVILFGLAGCQVLIAFVRPKPDATFRPLFNWLHWTIGNSAHICGIACIFLANDLTSAQLGSDEYLFVMLAAVLFHIVMHLAMSFHTVWADRQMESKSNRAVAIGPMKSNGLSNEAPGTPFRTFMMALYILGLLGCAITLIIFVSNSKTSSES